MISLSSRETACVEWDGANNGVGYGRVWRVKNGLRQKVYIHREVYAAVNGPIPEGMVVRHTCDNPRCVNPGHLILGTQADNVADSHERGRRTYVRRTHCKHGHAFSPENTTICAKDGSQQCRECRNAPRRKGTGKTQPYKARRPKAA